VSVRDGGSVAELHLLVDPSDHWIGTFRVPACTWDLEGRETLQARYPCWTLFGYRPLGSGYLYLCPMCVLSTSYLAILDPCQPAHLTGSLPARPGLGAGLGSVGVSHFTGNRYRPSSTGKFR